MSNLLASSNLSTQYDRHHWLTIDHELMSAVAVIEGTTIAIIFLGSLVANLLALTSILRDELLKANLHNWLIVNLIINDLGFTVTSMSFVIVSVFDHGRFLVQNEAVCLISGACALLFAFGNFSTVLAISVDRYLAVVWSTIFPPSKTRTIAFIVLCWVVPILNAIPPSFGIACRIRYQSIGHYCTADWEEDCLYFVTCVTIIFGVTVPVMAFCYVSVFWSVWRQQQLLRSHADVKGVWSNNCSVDEKNETGCSHNGVTSQDEPETPDVSKSSTLDGPIDGDRCELAEVKVRGQENTEARAKTKDRRKRRAMQRKLSMEKRIALTGTLLVMTTVVCWSPYCVVNPCLIPASSTPHWLSVSTVWLAYFNALLDPLIYSFMNRRVRACYGVMLGRLLSGCPRRTT